jgi:hypothetical protein
MMRLGTLSFGLALAMLARGGAYAKPAPAKPTYDERPATLAPATTGWNYERRVVDIPCATG